MRGTQHTGGNILLIGVAWVSPFFAMCYGAMKLLFSRGRWYHKLFVLSLVGNVFSAAVFAVGYYEYSKDVARGVPSEGAPIAPECVHRRDAPLQVCVAPEASEVATLFPNTVYVAFDEIIRGRFEFADDKMAHLSEVTITDSRGRPWVDAELDTGKVIYTRYSAQAPEDATVSLMDEDGDGTPDIMVDWVDGVRFQRTEELAWRRVTGDE